MSTVREVFDIAVHLMDEQNESTGSTDTTGTREYRLRTPPLLNSLLDRAYPASDTWPGTVEERDEAGVLRRRRPVCPKVTDMDDEIGLDERLCTGALPYGLAALLLTEEDKSRAEFFWQTFLEQLAEAMRGVPGGTGSVEDCYGLLGDTLEYGRFSRW